MPPTQDAVNRLTEALRLDTPLIAVYDCAPSDDFAPIVEAKGRVCCFAYYGRWLNGETVVIRKSETGFSNPQYGCHGAQMAFGLSDEYPSFMANFLTDGEGAPMGEGLKASPQLAQEYIDNAAAPPISGEAVLIGPLRLAQWDHVKSVTFLADPDRLAALMTLAAYWSSDPDFIYAPFSSGCGLLWRELEKHDRERAVIGCTDIAMRKHIPPELLALSVTPRHFERMVGFPKGAFLNRSWWNDLMKSREKARDEG
jgi:hypothetical protein